MSLRTKSLPVLAALMCVCLSMSANAQHLSLSVGRATHYGSLGLTLGLPLGYPTYTTCAPRQVWVPGHYETRRESVWVAGCTRKVWTPAQYEWRTDSCGRRYSVCVRSGRWMTVTDPGRYESRDVRVWVAGAWRHA